MYTLDTNTVIYYLQDDESVVSRLRGLLKNNVPLYISTMTEIELFGFPRLPADEALRIEYFLTIITAVPIDSGIARTAGSVKSRYGLKIPDSTIAATAISLNTTLITRNIRDFNKVPQLRVEKI